ncbi:MAG: BrnA antitoxin family protein [Pseudomonadota bacterium]
MSKSSSSKTSRTDWPRVKAMKDKDIKLTSEHPEADVKHVVRGILRQGLKPVPSKASISLRVDADVLEWFKAQGPGYQTRINAVLRAFKNASFDLPSAGRDKRRRAA